MASVHAATVQRHIKGQYWQQYFRGNHKVSTGRKDSEASMASVLVASSVVGSSRERGLGISAVMAQAEEAHPLKRRRLETDQCALC